MNDSVIQTRVQLIRVMVELQQIAAWLAANGENLQDKTILFIGASMMHVVKYANTTVSIINRPGVEHPVMGRRCVFY